MVGNAATTTYLSAATGDYDEVTIESKPGSVRIRLCPGSDLYCFGPDADEQVDLLLNRLRFELAAQVAKRGGR